jgi:carbamoyl-phosphate synthase large subunit
MTDEDVADVVYIEPLTVAVLTRIIADERPDGILPTLGGQTGLNLTVDLAEAGVLDKYSVRLLGTPLEAIRKAEDRNLFRQLLLDIGEPVPPSQIVSSMDEAATTAGLMGLPLVVRPAYTLGGTGGGIANTEADFESIVSGGIAASPISQVLLEKSLVGWKEIEYEVMRDANDNCITICNMENIDPMGVHTGDSIVVAPSQTLSDKEYQTLRSSSLKIIRALGIEGGCNVQFALNPGDIVAETLPKQVYQASDEIQYYVIEVNPRVSRSSALASKATGYPIARVSAKIAAGNRLDEIPNAVTKKTLAAFEPALDYCVVKIPRWPFDKFPAGDRSIGTQMKATGEVMAIDRNFEAAFQKAIRSLEITGRSILWEDPSWNQCGSTNQNRLPTSPSDDRIWALMASLRRGVSPEEISRDTSIDPWFTRAFFRIAEMERRLLSESLDPHLMRQAKRLGFSDATIASLSDREPQAVREMRKGWGLLPVYKMVDTCAAEFEAETPYFYSTYEQENEAQPSGVATTIVIGSGPIRIGQGIEFDYCSVHAAWALQQAGIQSVMINSNPETVSTDFDTSSRLYFEPLDEESVLDIIENEASGRESYSPTMVQFGGQTAINLSQFLDREEMPIIGSTAQSINVASDRHLFEEFLARVGIPNPPGAAVSDLRQARAVARAIGYPVLVRPSYVLGGRAMQIVENDEELVRFMGEAQMAGEGRRVLVDKYFVGREVEVDAVCDGETVLIPGIMEHVERAGVHSGDSMAIYPGLTLSKEEVDTVVDYTTRIGLALQVKGLMNIQYVIVGGPAYRSPGLDTSRDKDANTSVYVIEVNPRSSRTIPFISKVTGVPMVKLAVGAMLDRSLKAQGYRGGLWHKKNLVAVKAPVFSMSKLSGVDTYLGPEMKSTGEIMGIDVDFPSAFSKALIAAGLELRPGGSILLSIADRDKAEVEDMVRRLASFDFSLYATSGTAELIRSLDLEVTEVLKRKEGNPNVVDLIAHGTVDAVVNTEAGERQSMEDSFTIRRAAVDRKIPCFTSLDTARAAVESLSNGAVTYSVRPLHAYRGDD